MPRGAGRQPEQVPRLRGASILARVRLAAADLWSGLFPNLLGGLCGLAGVALGFWLARWSRTWGKVTFHVSNWGVWLQDKDCYHIPTGPDGGVYRFTFDLDVYSSKEEPTGLMKVRVEFCRGGRLLKSFVLTDGGSNPYIVCDGNPVRSGRIAHINFPPHEWLRLSLWGAVDSEEEQHAARGWDEVYLVGRWPGGKAFRQWVASRSTPSRDFDTFAGDAP
jgi:hypothetical protein